MAVATSRVVLVHGHGGSGKSSLLQYFRQMADGTAPDSPVPPGRIRTAWLDWEDELRDQPSRYADIEGPSLVTVLDALRAAVIDTTDKGHPSNVVSQMTRRYLIHAERTYPSDNPRHDDVAKILSLALVSGDRRPCWGG